MHVSKGMHAQTEREGLYIKDYVLRFNVSWYIAIYIPASMPVTGHTIIKVKGTVTCVSR